MLVRVPETIKKGETTFASGVLMKSSLQLLTRWGAFVQNWLKKESCAVNTTQDSFRLMLTSLCMVFSLTICVE